MAQNLDLSRLSPEQLSAYNALVPEEQTRLASLERFFEYPSLTQELLLRADGTWHRKATKAWERWRRSVRKWETAGRGKRPGKAPWLTTYTPFSACSWRHPSGRLCGDIHCQATQHEETNERLRRQGHDRHVYEPNGGAESSRTASTGGSQHVDPIRCPAVPALVGKRPDSSSTASRELATTP